MGKIYDIITMGSNVIDNFIYTDIKEKNEMICFPIGTKIEIKDVVFSTGGGGMNSAMCFSNLGLKTGYLGKLGSGYNSDVVLSRLRKNKIDFLGTKGKGHTGYSVILDSLKRNRTVLTYKGESDNLKLSEINLSKLKTRWFYFSSMSNDSFESQKKIAEIAGNRGIKIAYNPSSYQARKGVDYIKTILKRTFVLCLNNEEARMLVKENLHKNLLKLGPQIVCITDGDKEGSVYDGEYLYRYWPNKVKLREATGAGDAFGSSFVAGLIKFNDIEVALKMAIANSESVIQQIGAQNGLLNWREIDKIIKSKKFKIKKEALE